MRSYGTDIAPNKGPYPISFTKHEYDTWSDKGNCIATINECIGELHNRNLLLPSYLIPNEELAIAQQSIKIAKEHFVNMAQSEEEKLGHEKIWPPYDLKDSLLL